MDSIRMHKFSVYETVGRYYIFGSDVEDAHFKVLKIDRTTAPGQLSIVEDEIIYSRKQADALLQTIEDGNRNAGGMKLKTLSWGLLGFIRFTDVYYMLLVTKKQQVAMIGGRYIYQVDGTELVPLSTGSSSRFSGARNAEESRFLGILNNLDLHRSFYFSYSYNITRTLQHNVIEHRRNLENHIPYTQAFDYNDMFVWNQHLLDPALQALKNPYDWCVPIIHGFIDQAAVNVFGRNLYITLIARRSRFFAGARFLKRGANDLGYVANDVETEQIVADMVVTSFNTSKYHPLNNPNYTAFVQHRGSIPLYWTQDNTGVSPKPAIDITLIDPFYSPAALHFDNLFKRYRAPICVLNLVKARERTPRESKLLVEYQNAIDYLNQMLPDNQKIIYRAYDMSRALKTRGQDVIEALEEIAEELVTTTGFFHNGMTNGGGSATQNGVIRSNCIDCLDRTNAAQFVVGKKALAFQLQALGVIADTSLNYDCDASNLFAHMFNDHGDTLASQYGGSHLVNTTDSYRKISNWQSHSRDMLESFKRYYHNSFLDNQRQEAYNLFLGNYIYAQGQPMLWELPNDFYLHHTTPATRQKRRHYIKWYTPDHLLPQKLQPIKHPDRQLALFEKRDWWDEYYRPPIISSFLRIFAYRINSTDKYLPKQTSRLYDMSPFAVRKGGPTSTDPAAGSRSTSPASRPPPASSTENPNIITPLHVTSAPQPPASRISSLQNWLLPAASPAPRPQPASDPRPAPSRRRPSFTPADKRLQHQWTLGQFLANSLHPSVSSAEAAEYARYISHPERLAAARAGIAPLRASDAAHADYATYLAGAAPAAGSTPEDEDAVVELDAWLNVDAEPLGEKLEDRGKKRYQAYGKWVRGKSLFKQSKVDPEFGGVLSMKG